MKGHAVDHDRTDEGVPKTDDPGASVGEPGASGGHPEDEPGKTYDAAYVAKLREEAAVHRVRAKRAEDAEAKLRELAIAAAARDVLTDASDLPWSDTMADEDGWPDAAKITAAARELTERKPHLGRPVGDVGQGRHSDPDDQVNLAGLLRAGA